MCPQTDVRRGRMNQPLTDWSSARELRVHGVVRLRGLLPGEAGGALEARRLQGSGSPRTSSTAATSSSVEVGSNSRAASPTTSGSEATFEHATGQPHAIASSGGWPKPSYRLGNTSAAAVR